MTSLPKISIVTPSFNQGNFIEETITSVLNQNYPNLEYIIIDGGSTDNTIEVIKKYENHLTYWVSEPDQGQSHAINKGLQKCTGQVFNWLNSDDFLEPGALKHIGEEYRSEPFKALCCQTNVLDDSVFSHVRKPSFVGESVEDSIAQFNINQEGTWWSLDAVKKANGVNQSLHFCMDLDLWFKLLTSSSIESFRSSEQIVSNFRRHSNAKSTLESALGQSDSGFVREQLILFNELCPSNCRWDWFHIMDVSAPNYEITGVNYHATEKARKLITEKRLFELARKSYDGRYTEKAKQLLGKIGFWSSAVGNSDLWYLRRKLMQMA